MRKPQAGCSGKAGPCRPPATCTHARGRARHWSGVSAGSRRATRSPFRCPTCRDKDETGRDSSQSQAAGLSVDSILQILRTAEAQPKSEAGRSESKNTLWTLPAGNDSVRIIVAVDALRRAASLCCSQLAINFVEQPCQRLCVCDLDVGGERLFVVERRFERCAGVAAVAERFPDTPNPCP